MQMGGAHTGAAKIVDSDTAVDGDPGVADLRVATVALERNPYVRAPEE